EGCVVALTLPPPFRVHGPYAGVINGNPHINVLNAVSNLAIANTSGHSSLLGIGGHQLAPRPICTIAIRRMHNDVTGIQQIHSLDLKAVRILFNDASFNPFERSGTADKATVPHIR